MKKSFLLIPMIAMIVSCAVQLSAQPVALRLADSPYLTEGAGLSLSIPRILDTIPYLSPLQKQYKPGEIHAPVIFDLFPCSSFFCKKSAAGRAQVRISRLLVSDINNDPNNEEHLRRRIMSIFAKIEHEREESKRLNDGTSNRLNKFIPPSGFSLRQESLRIIRTGDALWGRVEQRTPDHRLVGLVYWRVLSEDLTMSASFIINEPTQLPKGATVEEIGASFEDFVGAIRVRKTS
jgi:hypothetical protein